MLSLITRDDRPFILSTPRLKDDQSLHLQVPYRNCLVDELFSMKAHSQPWSDIRDKLADREAPEQFLASLFTEDRPKPYQRYDGSGIRWRYFGHACILVESRDISILLDPVLSYTYESSISRYTYEDLPERIDYVLITHNHQDHILFETLLQLRHKIGHIVVPRNGSGAIHDPSMKMLLEAVGFRNIIELAEMQSIEFPDGSITGLPFLGEHSDLTVQTKLMYLVTIGRRRLMFAADSCNVEPRIYEHVQREVGDVDALFLGMECEGAPLTWLYGPLLTQKVPRAVDESRRLSGSNCDQGRDFIDRFHCKELYVYAMGQEPWLNYVMSIKYTDESRPIVESNKLIAECRARGMQAERLFGEKEILINA